MLRITQSSSAGAAVKYYVEGLSKGDYYVGNDAAISWGGKASERLGLSGDVSLEQFRSLAYNTNPVTGEKLNPRFSANRRVGYDFTFNATKSISMALEFSNDDSVKKDIKQAWLKSVNDTMNEIEQNMQTRTHKGLATHDATTGNMVWASVTHDRSRPVDGIPSPHLHQHVYVFNTTWNERKQRFQAGQFGQIKKDAPYYESIFHNHLAKNLMDKGFAITNENGKAELAGISREGIMAFSERTKQIEAHAKEKNITDPKAKSEIGAKKRESKSNQRSEAEVGAAWKERLPNHDRKAIDNLRGGSGNSSGGQTHAAEVAVKEHRIQIMLEDERKEKQRIQSNSKPSMSAKQALAFALEHQLENNSTVSEKKLLATAINHGLGSVTVEALKDEYDAQFVRIGTYNNGERYITTEQVLREEKQMIDFAKDGRGMYRYLTAIDYEIPEWFNKDQRIAVQHIWASPDSVTMMQGDAGTGKTTVMQTVAKGIEQDGKQIFALAPTSDATNMLANDGFSNTDTLAQFLVNKKLQESAKGQVVWLDEAGMVGTKDMSALFEIADKQDMRVILTGDTKQHGAIRRGDAMRLLSQRAGINVVEVKEVQRQKPALYKKAISWLGKGGIKEGFEQLNEMGAIKQIPDEVRYKHLAKDYLDAVDKGMSALVVSPTNSEKDKVTDEVRIALKASGKIDQEEKLFTVHKTLHLSEAEKKDIRIYKQGQHIELNQNITGFTKGERLEVIGTSMGRVDVKKQDGSLTSLAMRHADRFNLFEKEQIDIAKGDVIRITKGGSSDIYGAKTRFSNGKRYSVEGFTEYGDIRLVGGRIISKNYGNFDYGIVSTSYSSQGQTVDKVIIANASESFGKATNLEQFYVSASRGKMEVTVYTDDKDRLLEQVQKTSERLSATELLEEKRHSFWRERVRLAIENFQRAQDYLKNRQHPDRDISPTR